MNLSAFNGLVASWKNEADSLRHRGYEREAVAAESYADEMEAALREYELEALTLDDAAQESPFQADTLRRKVARGEIPNAGTKGRPRIRRCDLSGKNGQAPSGPSLLEVEASVFGGP